MNMDVYSVSQEVEAKVVALVGPKVAVRVD